MSAYDMVYTTDFSSGSETIDIVPQIQQSRQSEQATTMNSGIMRDSGAGKSVVIIMGATGVGKSSFVAHTTGHPVTVGHSLRSCTTECQAWDYHLNDGHVVRLVDTPGFNDTTRSDMDILVSIASWIQANDSTITGIIYLHRITDIRFSGASRMNLQVLKALCGERFFPHLVVSTTMWNGLPDNTATTQAAAREKELVRSPEMWNDILCKGAKYLRFMGTQDSGKAIIHHLLAQRAAPPMDLTMELRDRSVEETAAGQLITEELRRREEKLRQELQEEEEEERLLKEDLEIEQEVIRREAQRKREQEEMATRRAGLRPVREVGGRGMIAVPRRVVEVRPSRGTSDASETARRAAQVSWFGTINLEMPFPFGRR